MPIAEGICGYCTQNQDLAFARYGVLICERCEHLVGASLHVGTAISCAVCHRSFSCLWGHYAAGGKFVCLGCSYGTKCQLCRTESGVRLAQSIPGPIYLCDSCFSTIQNNGNAEMTEDAQISAQAA